MDALMLEKIIDTVKQLDILIPKMESVVHNNTVFLRYILPAIIAGSISFFGIIFNNMVSIYLNKKNDKMKYGEFYVDYLSYLKQINNEIELYKSDYDVANENIWAALLKYVNKKENANSHFISMLSSFNDIKTLISEKKYFILNNHIHNTFLNIHTLILYLDLCETQNLSDVALNDIIQKVEALKINIQEHISSIENQH